MNKVKVEMVKTNTTEFYNEFSKEDVDRLMNTVSERFSVNLMEIVKKISEGRFDGFFINGNNPYCHLFIGNGINSVSFEFKTLQEEIKIKFPKEELSK
jgi:hypothetical protein